MPDLSRRGVSRADRAETTTPIANQTLDGGKVGVLWRMFAAHDLLLLAYLLIVGLLLWVAEPSPAVEGAMHQVYGCTALLIVGCFWGHTTEDAPLRGVVYRVTVVGCILWDYLMLRNVLPIIRPDSVDATLSSIDIFVFGRNPALWFEQFNTHGVVEWFSFFYFSYFTICAIYMVAVIWILRPARQTSEFAIGTAIVCCGGQLLYMAVPANGPTVFLADQYHGPVQGGFFWALVTAAVHAGSAMKDVFPSLHTAVPTWFSLFALRRGRRDWRWYIPATITSFFAANIVISTMLLRWHYVIDVMAGLCLASFAAYASVRLAAWDEARRAEGGRLPAWPPVRREKAPEVLAEVIPIHSRVGDQGPLVRVTT